MTHLIFGFRDLINTQPNTSIFDVSSLLFDDTYLKTISPNRYNFYVKFISGLSNPAVLEQFFYKVKESKDYRNSLNKKIKHLSGLLKRLNTNFDTSDKNKIIEDITNVIKNKFKLDETETNKIGELLNSTNKKGGAPPITTRNAFIQQYDLNKGAEPMKEFINKLNMIDPTLGQKPPLNKIEDILIDKANTSKTVRNKSRPDTIKELKGLYDNYKDDLSPESLEISMIDRAIFIASIFIIRQISLTFVDWGLNTNVINTFHKAFFMYCFVYLIFFIFIIMLVNVVVYYPILELFSNTNITNIPNYLYYYYIYTNGFMRLIVHMLIIIILLFIPYLINIDKIKILWFDENNKNISYNIEQRNNIYQSISLFSFIIWILTSFIALKF
jgi:hypothetical protein